MNKLYYRDSSFKINKFLKFKKDFYSNERIDGNIFLLGLKIAIKESRDGDKLYFNGLSLLSKFMCNSSCYFCSDYKDVHLHHIIRRDIGGLDTDNNLLPLCRKCHNKAHKIGNKLLWSNGKWYFCNNEGVILKKGHPLCVSVKRGVPNLSIGNKNEFFRNESSNIIVKEGIE